VSSLETALCRELGVSYPVLSVGSGELTDRPFGVNVILAELEDPSTPEEDRTFIEHQIQTALAQRAAAVAFFWGDPLPFVADAHRSGAKVLVQVGPVDEARNAADGVVDEVKPAGEIVADLVRAAQKALVGAEQPGS
jgi:NAD(P)H-dependent flavin oxidoreductase YrpB (nitropropane dioxygenase family)